MKKYLLAFSVVMLSLAFANQAEASSHGLKGRILLQVENEGQLWYVVPKSNEIFAISSGYDAARLLRYHGLGITNADIEKIPAYGQPRPAHADSALTRRLAGYILIQVEDKGKAWYVNPVDHLRYSLGRPNEAHGLFRNVALGISNKDIAVFKETKSIVDVAVASGNFKTLVAAVQAAGLAETLDKDGPFTVFAPTDEAFAKLPEGTVEALLNDIPQLKSILLYHVVAGRVMAADAIKLSAVPTLNGQSFMIKVEGGKVMVDNALVTATDIKAENGVIHVIDSVILPK